MPADQSSERIKFLRGLRAVRDYTADPVSDDVLNDILEVGRWAGSASNKQPTEVVVVRDAGVKQIIADGGVRPAAGAAVALVVLTPADDGRRDIDNFDNGRLVERLLLAAHAHGLGANIGTLKEGGPDAVKQALGIPDGLRPWTVVTLGVTDEAARKARPKPQNAGRKESGQFAHWDRYQAGRAPR